jgi:hypothetical protein
MPPDVFDEAVQVLLELPREARLADPGHTDDGDEARALVVRGRVEKVFDKPELAVAAHERRLEGGRTSLASSRAHDTRGPPELDRLCLPLQLVRARLLVGDRGLGCALGRLADEDRARLRRALHPRGGVHEVARDQPLAVRADRDGSLAREDACPRAQVGRAELLAEDGDAGDEVERGSNGALGVVLLGNRGSPHGHHRVADELLDGAAVALDDLSSAVEVPGQELARLLGVTVFGCARETDEVCEEH